MSKYEVGMAVSSVLFVLLWLVGVVYAVTGRFQNACSLFICGGVALAFGVICSFKDYQEEE